MALPETFVLGFHDEDEVRKMKYNYLGQTGLRVSKLALGTGGFSYLYGAFDVEECKKTVHEAIRRGINLIDTAPFYGHGVSEEVLGKCLVGIPRKAYYLATKVARYGKEPKEQFNFTAEKTLESIDTSLKRLGIDYVDILQVHDIEFAPSLDLVLNETLPTVEKIVKSGKARFIGVTGYPVSKLAECIEKSSVTINSVLSYSRLTMFDDTLLKFIPTFKARKIGVISAAANALGLLSSFGPPPWHPALQHIKDICTEAREYCKKLGVELGNLAVYHSLSQEGPDTILVGMNTVKILESNLNVLFNGLTQKEKEAFGEVMKILSKLQYKHWENVEVENYWKTIRALENN